MFPEKIEKAFGLHLEAIQLLQNALKTSFIEAYIENVENVLDEYQVRVMDGQPDEVTTKRIEGLYEALQEISLAPEEIRKLSQLLLLKGSKSEPLQPNHQLTPDGIGFLFVYLLEQFFPADKALTLFDPAVGMGNLLLTALTNLRLAKRSAKGFGVDIDETLLAVAAADTQWTQSDVTLFHQDALQDLLLDPVDAVLSDLPVGYYPQDEQAQNFLTGVAEGHSYAHHLLIEQGMKYTKENGFGLFLLPANFLESEQGPQLKKLFTEKMYLQGIIQLPDELFLSKASQKSIILVQNHGEKSQQVPEVLVAKLATLKDPVKITEFFTQFEDWKASNL
ncbi:adenine-specific methyltransferase [Enterococcus asini ATCC 700915]|uniref:Adenine-specific methyltransferase n=1 Tax=Enterococcus asini ATCC 700915 TaxID=1158606 RepID=R2PPB5_9ENTE|nr:class I SAM-dependent methyltransferase [Enterococcus asini]EOH85133.1 adenine-specific methyltransferase [Enterococcus asini ATCC 700915]EOT57501.1 adenine-specific methyltransferase [Enterococcus asini ATCC 700915]OJG12578.1 adenine-specific methyltransferase [Enterococcus asini]